MLRAHYGERAGGSPGGGRSIQALGRRAGTAKRFLGPPRFVGPDYERGDWLDTAAVFTNLDLVISPDTAITHLAGAMSKPAWLALPRPAEWRWMRGREDSPWYPTMRLFRQERPGEWGLVFRRMAEALGEITQATGAPRDADREDQAQSDDSPT